ncbi:MAG: hypothetical protein KKC03_13970 [Bacteroidetes bacterium]|nr:hypothetical protein [Bacteroidota bacterium]
MPFVKLDCKILDKSIWRESPEVCKVWITILAMADQDGLVEAAIPGIADRARVSLKETEKAIMKFQAPDKYSSNPDHDGKRIERTGRGFKVLNYNIYREFSYSSNKDAVRKRKYRESIEGDIVGHVPLCPGHSASASASASASESKKCKLEDKIKEKIEALKKAWYDQIQYYMVKYPGLDYNLELEKIEEWIKEKPSKSLKKKSWNLFIHNWLGRARPNFGFKKQVVQKTPETDYEKEHKFDSWDDLNPPGQKILEPK